MTFSNYNSNLWHNFRALGCVFLLNFFERNSSDVLGMGGKHDTELVGPKLSEHDFQCILFAKSAQINFSRRILGESFQHTEKIAVHNSLQNDSHKNQVLGERQREAGQLLQTEVSFHQSSVSRAEKNSSCFILAQYQFPKHYYFVLNR